MIRSMPTRRDSSLKSPAGGAVGRNAFTPPGGPERTAARWEQIADALREDIASGRLAPGTRLPNETQLAERFGVHRHTLRQALRALADAGYVQARQGSGTTVRELVLDYALQRRTRLTHNLAEAGETARRELLGHETVVAGAWAAGLRVPARSRVLLLHTRASVRGRPIAISTAAFPLPRCEGLVEHFLRERRVTAALAACGIADYTRERSTVSCRLPAPAEADALARAATQPLLVVQYVNVDAAGVPVESGHTCFAGDAVQLSVAPDAA